MLGRLLKYDLKWVYKVIVVFYILAFIFSIIGRALSTIENSVVFSVVSKIIIGTAIAMMINSLVNGLMRLWARMVKNVYKDESYLTHTLPVEKKTIYASQVISAVITTLTTVAVILVCLFICYYSEANMEALKTMLEIAASTYNTTVVNLLVLIAGVLFCEIMFMVLIGYVGIILGHKSNERKMLKTLVISFGLYMAFQVLTLVMMYVLGLFNPEVMNLINTTDAIDVETIKAIMYAAIGVYGAYSVLLFAIGKKQLEKGVNVE